MHYSHYIKLIITSQKEKKKKKRAETRESPNVDTNSRNNPIQTHINNTIQIQLN